MGRLATQRARDPDFSDMPSLSSFRADEMSAVTSTSYTSHSKGGDSRGGDCDDSLPSLSSFRMEDLSTCSSYHSLQTNTNHLSDQSVEGWSSFTSGNVSAETDSEDGKRRHRLPHHANAPMRPSRSSSGSSLNSGTINGSPIDRNTQISVSKGVIKHNTGIPLKATAKRRTSGQAIGSKESNSSPMVRPTRTSSPTHNEHHNNTNLNQTSGSARATETPRQPARNHSPHRNSPKRESVERTKSLDLTILQRPPNSKDKTGSVMEGSSSSLRGGDSLPRLPRRTSAGDDESFRNDAGRADDASNFSDVSTKISDDEVTRISDDHISLDSDVESDISIDTDTEHLSLADYVSDKSSVESTRIANLPEGVIKRTSEGAKPPGDGNNALDRPESRVRKNEEIMHQTVDTDDGNSREAIQASAPAHSTASDQMPIPDSTIEERSSADPDPSSATNVNEIVTDNVKAEPEDATIGPKKGRTEPKRSVFRNVSSSFKHIGKTSSFTFKAIGKTASKLKLRAFSRKPKDEDTDASTGAN